MMKPGLCRPGEKDTATKYSANSPHTSLCSGHAKMPVPVLCKEELSLKFGLALGDDAFTPSSDP